MGGVARALIFEALLLKLIVLDELIGSAVVGVSLVENVLTHLFKSLSNVGVVSEELIHDSRIELRIFSVDLLLVDEV